MLWCASCQLRRGAHRRAHNALRRLTVPGGLRNATDTLEGQQAVALRVVIECTVPDSPTSPKERNNSGSIFVTSRTIASIDLYEIRSPCPWPGKSVCCIRDSDVGVGNRRGYHDIFDCR